MNGRTAGKHRFQAEIKSRQGGGAFIVVPFDIVEALGKKDRIPVRALFDGEPYRGSIVPMGGVHVLDVTREIREAIDKTVGDMVHIVVERDAAPV